VQRGAEPLESLWFCHGSMQKRVAFGAFLAPHHARPARPYLRAAADRGAARLPGAGCRVPAGEASERASATTGAIRGSLCVCVGQGHARDRHAHTQQTLIVYHAVARTWCQKPATLQSLLETERDADGDTTQARKQRDETDTEILVTKSGPVSESEAASTEKRSIITALALRTLGTRKARGGAGGLCPCPPCTAHE
jgi:hypothetical protein